MVGSMVLAGCIEAVQMMCNFKAYDPNKANGPDSPMMLDWGLPMGM